MKKLLILLMIPMTMSLGGCVIVAGGHDDDWDYNSWESQQNHNRKAIANLQIGTLKKDVLKIMGEPDFNESFTDNGKVINVLYYRTQRTKGDGKTTRDETTPLVFIDGSLNGWGQKSLQQAMGFEH